MAQLLINASNWKLKTAVEAIIYQTGRVVGSLPETFERAKDPAFWQKQQGSFACLISNRDQSEFICVRDPFGAEPFYYCQTDQQFIFSSNLPDLFKFLAEQPAFNDSQILATLTRRQRYSDETFHQGVFRVEPGTLLHFKNGQLHKTPYWQLDPFGLDRTLANDQTYLDRFSELLHEAVTFNTEGEDKLAGEISGGLDSSSIFITAREQQTTYPLYMHVPEPGKNAHERELAESLLSYFNCTQANFVDASQFNIDKVFKRYQQLYKGFSPYLFFVLADNVLQKVACDGRKVLLSGMGGDQCVSGIAPRFACLTQVTKEQGFVKAYQALMDNFNCRGKTPPSLFRRFEQLLRFYHPAIYYSLAAQKSVREILKNYFRKIARQPIRGIDKAKPFYHSLRHFEYDCLQGANSYEVRTRLEYSAVAGKAVDVEYRYPLLYPKLVEFCFYLPLEQKCRNGVSRYLMRQYLKKHVPKKLYQHFKKDGTIFPATEAVCRREMQSYSLQALQEKYAVASVDSHHEFCLKMHAKVMGL